MAKKTPQADGGAGPYCKRGLAGDMAGSGQLLEGLDLLLGQGTVGVLGRPRTGGSRKLLQCLDLLLGQGTVGVLGGVIVYADGAVWLGLVVQIAQVVDVHIDR